MTALLDRQGRVGLGTTLALLVVLGAGGFAIVKFAVPHFFGSEPLIDEKRIAELKKAELPAAGEPKKGSGFDWPQWRGPNRDGASLETGLLTRWPDDPKKLIAWEARGGGGFTSFAVVKGRVLTLLQDDDHEAAVCWDADSGKELWRFRYPEKYENGFGGGPRATPTVDGNLVYTVGATGIMHCLKLDAQNPKGEKVWRRDLLEDFKAENLEWGVSFSPLVEGDLIYVNPGGSNGGSLAALDKKTGKTVWQSENDTAGYSSPMAATLAGKRQIVFFTEKGLVSVTPDAGKVLWRFPWKTKYGANIATPIIAGDYVFISTGYNRGCAMLKVESAGEKLAAKRVYENKNMCNHFANCVRYGDYLYGFNDGELACLELRTGEVRWSEEGFAKGSLTIADGHLIILGERGKLALAVATPEGYREKSSFQLFKSQCWSVPVLSHGRLYVRDESKVICLDLRKK